MDSYSSYFGLKVLNGLLFNEVYRGKVYPFLKEEYFEQSSIKTLFKIFKSYFIQYGTVPSKDVFIEEVQRSVTLTQDLYDEIIDITSNLLIDDPSIGDWLFDKTQDWCRRRELYISLKESVQELSRSSSKIEETKFIEISEKIQKAASMSFDTNIGLDYDNETDLLERYNSVSKKIPFDISVLNDTTSGGFSLKTLNIIMASMGVGKSAFMCSYAASQLLMQKDVLYISMEMSEDNISTRIDANLLDTSFDNLKILYKTPELYRKKRAMLREKGLGRLVIKEFPPGGAGAVEFKHLLQELYLKKNGFKPQVICIDYLGICKSNKVSPAGGSYGYLKSISEELRALAVEQNCIILTASQTNRGGIGASTLSLSDISDSIGISATADYMLALISDSEIAEQNKCLCIQLKNRYANMFENRKFYLGYDRTKSKFFELEGEEARTTQTQPQQSNEDTPVFDMSTFGERLAALDEKNNQDRFKKIRF